MSNGPMRVATLFAGFLAAIAAPTGGCSPPPEATPPAAGRDAVATFDGGDAEADTTSPRGDATPGPDGGDAAQEPRPDDAGAPPEDSGRPPRMPPSPPYPHTALPRGALPVVRGMATVRGIVHAHTPYSHDACDGEPLVDGAPDPVCRAEFRAAACDTGQDFVFLTDHTSFFADHEFPDVLLHDEGADTLVERNGRPVANRMACPDGGEVLLMAGNEGALMPVGLEGHVGATPAARRTAYGDGTPAGAAALRAAGAVVLVAHTEGFDVETLLGLPLDGIEIYNLHQNLMDRLADALLLLGRMGQDPASVPHPEVALLALWAESEADLTRWAHLVQVRPTVGVLATDVHRNVSPDPAPDGERVDSFRRLMRWFSNYVLLAADTLLPPDDTAIKASLRVGRVFGAFDVLGYPVGFDFHARSGDRIFEMGAEVSLGAGPVDLVVVLPAVVHLLDPAVAGPSPAVTARILRATEEGSWEEVARGAEGEGLIHRVETPGAYRAEVRMVPTHLLPWLGSSPEEFLREVVWVYSNPIYVGGGSGS